MPDRPTDTQKRLAAYMALMDAVVAESAYWAGEREDADRVQFLAAAVEDPSNLPDVARHVQEPR